jgi:hypothetical protein
MYDGSGLIIAKKGGPKFFAELLTLLYIFLVLPLLLFAELLTLLYIF